MKGPQVRRACPIDEGFEGERDELSDERVEALVRRFRDKQAFIAVIGLGYVGLPLSLAASGVGFRVLGLDSNADRVKDLNAGKSPLKHIGHDLVASTRAEKRFACYRPIRKAG